MIRFCSYLAEMALCALIFGFAGISAVGKTTSANRLNYLDEDDPFYVNAAFPKLITPQWVGEPGVEAVVVLAIDDMKQPEPWEKFLRPILERLKEIDGRAPISIMTVNVPPEHPQLQAWLKEGLSLEAHTLTHPCPCLAKGDFQFGATNYHDCVAQLNRVPGNRPVAFRMPCCDSMNSPSPRFYAEIFNQTNSGGQFLTIDSSVMNIFTSNSPALPRSLVLENNGRPRFQKYLPFPSFATTIEDYPYPYIIGRLCWEFPCVVPSDWEAQHLHGTNSPITVADWKAALDATVLAQGTMNLVFHPHGWILPEQIVELIDYAVQHYGKKVKFLNFREAQARLDENLLHGIPLRAANGQDNGVRLLDLNGDGYLDVLVGNESVREGRVWNVQGRSWTTNSFPIALVLPDGRGERRSTGARFGIIRDGRVSVLLSRAATGHAWTFQKSGWEADDELLAGFALDGKPVMTARDSGQGLVDAGVRFRDLDGDGVCELLVGNENQNAIFRWSQEEKEWTRLGYSLPPNTSFVDAQGRDNGLRFVDVNEDGFADIIFSNEKRYSFHLFIPELYLGFLPGWSREVISGNRGTLGELPMITRKGSNNGAWVNGRTLWVQNEDTATLPDKVDRRSFDSLLGGLQPPPLSPQDSLKALQLKPGFKAELVAQEPLIEGPISFEWGADGKLWVVEMVDYPLGIDGKGKPGGIVRFLEDTNHDGIYDKSTVFLDGLNFPTGVIPWGKGVLISAAPEILYAEDTDGDGKADVRKVLFTGFHEGNQQHRVNGFEYGLDNWVYGANGDSGGQVHSELTGKRVNIDGRDFRFRPGDGSFETQAGNAQYGRHRDDWGNWFGNNNSAWLWHYFIPEQYIARNPHLGVRTTKRMLADYADWTRVFPASRILQRFNDVRMAGHVTSGCSATPYRDDLFGPDFASSVFVCEPVHNLVHREVLEPNGVSFSSHRSSEESQKEFLASTDNWFRPVMVKTGPDGALYIADMYRLVIEHPEWIPGDVKSRLDLRAGHDKGRLYRVYPEGASLKAIPRLAELDIPGLVAALESPNGWQRDTAQRLLIERADKRAIEPLKNLFRKSPATKTRVQCLWTLDGLGSSTPEILTVALTDRHAAVREHAVRLCETFLKQGKEAPNSDQLAETLLRLVDDPSIRVRYQLALSLGEWNDPRGAQVLIKIATKDVENEDIQTAVMSSALPHLSEMLTTLCEQPARSPPSLVDKLLTLAAAMNDEDSLVEALSRITTRGAKGYEAWQFTALSAVLSALDRRGQSLGQFQDEAGPKLQKTLRQLEPLFSEARLRVKQAAQNSDMPADLVPAISLLGLGRTEREQDWQQLGNLLQPQFSLNIHQTALTGLRRASGKQVGSILIDHWQASSPAMRPELLDIVLSRREWTESLLDALEANRIPAAQIGAPERQKLRSHRVVAIRARAEKLFSSLDANRQTVLAVYKNVPSLKGDRQHGAVLFQQNCAQCHEPQNGRPQVGPDLRALADKSVETLLIAILDPNRAVETRYVNYTAVTRDEREFSGVIVAETANSITLLSPASEETLLRTELQQFTSSGLSLMPEGFEKILNPQDAADLIDYLRNSLSSVPRRANNTRN